jgi:hypothetical protein
VLTDFYGQDKINAAHKHRTLHRMEQHFKTAAKALVAAGIVRWEPGHITTDGHLRDVFEVNPGTVSGMESKTAVLDYPAALKLLPSRAARRKRGTRSRPATLAPNGRNSSAQRTQIKRPTDAGQFVSARQHGAYDGCSGASTYSTYSTGRGQGATAPLEGGSPYPPNGTTNDRLTATPAVGVSGVPGVADSGSAVLTETP